MSQNRKLQESRKRRALRVRAKVSDAGSRAFRYSEVSTIFTHRLSMIVHRKHC